MPDAHPSPYWFADPAVVAVLRAEARLWLGTPFCLHASARGAGVDCVHLVHELAQATGWKHELRPPDYGAQDTLHGGASKLHAYLDEAEHITRVGDYDDARPALQPGDLVTFNIGRNAHHIGMVLKGDEFVHVMARHVVKTSRLDDPTYGRRAARVYRLLNPDR